MTRVDLNKVIKTLVKESLNAPVGQAMEIIKETAQEIKRIITLQAILNHQSHTCCGQNAAAGRT